MYLLALSGRLRSSEISNKGDRIAASNSKGTEAQLHGQCSAPALLLKLMSAWPECDAQQCVGQQEQAMMAENPIHARLRKLICELQPENATCKWSQAALMHPCQLAAAAYLLPMMQACAGLCLQQPATALDV